MTTTEALGVRWIHGMPGEPAIQVHHYDEHTVILRQSKAVNYEAPFLFLLFGEDRALLLDTGATAEPELFPLRAVVDGLIAERRPGPGYELVVAHSHGHHDHVAADQQFTDRPDTTVVPRDVEAVRAFFGLTERASFDLGGRLLEILASPGHHEAAITIYDPWTRILFTGDTVLPGRLWVFDESAFLATMDRLVKFADTHPVSHVLGCHVELSLRGRVYPIGSRHHARERHLELTPAHLTAVQEAARSVAGRRGVHRFSDFVIFNQPRKIDLWALLTRARLHKVLRGA